MPDDPFAKVEQRPIAVPPALVIGDGSVEFDRAYSRDGDEAIPLDLAAELVNTEFDSRVREAMEHGKIERLRLSGALLTKLKEECEKQHESAKKLKKECDTVLLRVAELKAEKEKAVREALKRAAEIVDVFLRGDEKPCPVSGHDDRWCSHCESVARAADRIGSGIRSLKGALDAEEAVPVRKVFPERYLLIPKRNGERP
jgi:hypothetical protein